jgi:uncharacterized protein YcnI
MSINYFSFSLLGKYPISLGSKLTLSPMVGFDWNIATSYQLKYNGTVVGNKVKRSDVPDDDKNKYDGFLINIGAGADFALTQKLYLRLSAMYGFKTKSKAEKDWITDMKDEGAEKASVFTGGPTIKLGVGFKF